MYLVKRGSFVGTPEYMAPELVKDTMCCFASDLWALGCSIYHMICSRPPFRGVTEYMTMKKVQEGLNVRPLTLHPLLDPHSSCFCLI